MRWPQRVQTSGSTWREEVLLGELFTCGDPAFPGTEGAMNSGPFRKSAG
jgi:hypothetical protein